MVDQRLFELRLADLVGRGEHRFQVAIGLDQLRRGLRADPRYSRHVVDAVAHQRQHVADLLGRHAELLQHLGAADPPVVHGVEHVDAGILVDQLHQVLVGADDRHLPAGLLCRRHVAGDDVVCLQARLLDAGDREGLGSGADQRELRDQILGRRRTVRLVLVVHLVAMSVLRRVEDHRHVGRPVRPAEVAGELPQHGRIAIHRARRSSVTVRQRRQPVIGAEDVARPVNEIEMGRSGGCGSVRHEGAGLAGWRREGSARPVLLRQRVITIERPLR